MSRDSFFVPGAEGSRGRVCLRGIGLSPWPSLPAGRDFGPVRTCGAFPPTAARRAPPVHEATGGYAVRSPCPSGIPRPRHNASPIGLEGLPCFDLFAASIRKSGPEIKNRCTDCPCFDLLAASIRKSGPEIGNRCSTFVAAAKNGPPTAKSWGCRRGQDATKAA